MVNGVAEVVLHFEQTENAFGCRFDYLKDAITDGLYFIVSLLLGLIDFQHEFPLLSKTFFLLFE